MGEIAEALRRARGRTRLREESAEPSEGRPQRLDEPAALSLDLGPESEPPEFSTSQGLWVETLRPNAASVVAEDGPQAEICRHLALRLRDQMDQRNARSVAIVSAERADGKTTVACNLALSLATLARGRSVALLDLDLRKPSIADYLSFRPGPGIEQVLLGKVEMEEVLVSVRHPAIDIYPAMTPQRAAHELLVLPKLAEVIARLERRYSTLIIDTPPAPLVPDANLVLRHAGGCVAVVRKGKTRARSLRRLVECLPSRQVVGWIVNGDRGSELRDSDYYYYGTGSQEVGKEKSGFAATRLRRLRRGGAS